MKTIKILLLCFFVMNTAIGDTAFGHGIDLGRVQDKLAPSSVFDDGLQGIQHKDIGRLTASLEYSLLSLPCDIESVNFVSLVKQLNEYRPSIFDKTHFFFREAKIIPGTDSVVIRGKIKDEKDQNDEDLVRTYYMVFHSKKDENNGFSIEVYTDKEWKKSEKFVKDGILPVRELSKPQDAFTIRRYVTDNEGVSGVDGHIRKRISEGAFTEIAGRTRDIGWDEKYPYREKPRSYWSEELLEMIKGEKDLPDGKNTRLDVFLERFGTSVEKAFTDKNIVFLKNNSDKSSILGSFLENTGIVRSVKVKGHASRDAVYVFLSEKDFNTLSLMFKAERKGRKPGKKRVSRMVKEITDVLVHEIGVVYGLNFGFHENTGRILNSMDHMWEEFRITNEKGEAFDAEYITGLAEKYPLTEDIFDIEGTIDLDRNLVKREYLAAEQKTSADGVTLDEVLALSEKVQKVFRKRGYVSRKGLLTAVMVPDMEFSDGIRHEVVYFYVKAPYLEGKSFGVLIDGERTMFTSEEMLLDIERLTIDVKNRKPETQEEAEKVFAIYFGFNDLNVTDVEAWLESLDQPASEYINGVLEKFAAGEKIDLKEKLYGAITETIVDEHIIKIINDVIIPKIERTDFNVNNMKKITPEEVRSDIKKILINRIPDSTGPIHPEFIDNTEDLARILLDGFRGNKLVDPYELMAVDIMTYIFDYFSQSGLEVNDHEMISSEALNNLCRYVLGLAHDPDLAEDGLSSSNNKLYQIIIADMDECIIRCARDNGIHITELGEKALRLLEQLDELSSKKDAQNDTREMIDEDEIVNILQKFAENPVNWLEDEQAVLANSVLFEHGRGIEIEKHKEVLEAIADEDEHIFQVNAIGLLLRHEPDHPKRRVFEEVLDHGMKMDHLRAMVEALRCGYKPDEQIKAMLQRRKKGLLRPNNQNSLCSEAMSLIIGGLLEAGLDDKNLVSELVLELEEFSKDTYSNAGVNALGFLVCNGYENTERIRQLTEIARLEEDCYKEESIKACEFLLKRNRQIEEEKARKEREDKKAKAAQNDIRETIDEDEIMGILKGYFKSDKHLVLLAKAVLMDYEKDADMEGYKKDLGKKISVYNPAFEISIIGASLRHEKDAEKKEHFIKLLNDHIKGYRLETWVMARLEMVKCGYDPEKYIDILVNSKETLCSYAKPFIYGTLLEAGKDDGTLVPGLVNIAVSPKSDLLKKAVALGYLVCNGHDSPERIEELLRIARGKKVREGIIACEFLLKRLRQIEEEKARKEREDKKAEDDSYRQMLDEAESSLGYDDLVGILQGLSRGSKSHIRIPANVVLMDYGKGSEECENYLKVMTRRSYGTLVIRIMRALAKNEKDHVKKEKLIAEIYEYCDAHEDDTDSKIRGVIELLKIGYDYQRHLDRLKALACLASCEEGKALVYGTLLEHKKADKDMVDDLEQLSLYGGPEARTLSLGFLVCNGYENDERVKELESIAEASEIFASKVDACEFLLKRLRQKEEEKTRKEREDKKAKDALSWQALEDAETDLGYDGLVGILHGFTKERERKYRALFAKAVLLDHEREGNETEENKKDLENAGFAIGYIHAPTFFGALARCERDIKKREILIRRIEYDSLGWKREKRTVGIIELFKCGYKPDTQIEKLLEIIDKNELCPTGEPLVYGTLLEAGKDDGTFVRKLEKISEREDPFLRANALGYLICNGHETPERTKELFNIARRPEGRASIAACEFLLKRIRKIQQKGLEKITPMAHRAGVTVAPPVSKYKLIVDQTLCKVEEAGQDKKGYVLPDGRHVGTGDRFEVEVLDTSKIGSIRNHIGSEEEAKNTIVQISGEVPEEDLKSLKSQGVRFIRIDTNDLKISGMNKDARRDARFDVYSVMLLARNITERDIREYSDTYRLLKFLVNTRFEDMAKTEEYISCLTKENLSAILSTNLPYRPAEKWDIEEYRLVISTLISA